MSNGATPTTPEKTFVDDTELEELQALHAYAQAKGQESRLAQLAVEAYIRWLAARHGLDPGGRYAVSPRGELLVLPPEGRGDRVEGQGHPEAPPPESSLGSSQEVAQ